MAYSNLTVVDSYDGSDVSPNTTYPIPFSFEEVAQVQAELWDYSDPANPTQLSFTNPADWTVIGTDIETTVAPTGNQKLLVFRETVPTHPTEYTEYEFPYETANVDLDRVYQLTQENREALGRAILNTKNDVYSGGATLIKLEDLAQPDDLADIQADILTLQTDLGTAQADILSNDGDIATLQSDLTALEVRVTALEAAVGGGTLTIVNASGTYLSSATEKVIVKASGVTVELPATPNANEEVLVKTRGTEDVTIDGNGNTIDGGASYLLEDDEGSLSFVYDGTEWVII